jgi:hypothetical protein
MFIICNTKCFRNWKFFRVQWSSIQMRWEFLICRVALCDPYTHRHERKFTSRFFSWTIILTEKIVGLRADIGTTLQLNCVETPAVWRPWPENGPKRHRRRRRKRRRMRRKRRRRNHNSWTYERFTCSVSLMKRQFVVTHTIRHIEIPEILDNYVRDTHVKMLCPRKKKVCPYIL